MRIFALVFVLLIAVTGCNTDDTDVPTPCPCPTGSYCDLTGNTCKMGCQNSEQCGPGRVCDIATRACRAIGGEDSAIAGDMLSLPAGDMACSPEKVACGRCGTKTGTCTDGGLVFGACEGERACVAGTSESSVTGCVQRTCGADCRWGPWGYKPGNMCDTPESRSCIFNPALCDHTGTMKCINCQWGPCVC